ncbi:hypothetical protein ACIQXA_40180 [Streptomyces massasporeus]|uniref:hypothetical protein n=1 Tax=Streptomyces massasporeus TaxID=67324 RepID=UPI00380FDFCD
MAKKVLCYVDYSNYSLGLRNLHKKAKTPLEDYYPDILGLLGEFKLLDTKGGDKLNVYYSISNVSDESTEKYIGYHYGVHLSGAGHKSSFDKGYMKDEKENMVDTYLAATMTNDLARYCYAKENPFDRLVLMSGDTDMLPPLMRMKDFIVDSGMEVSVLYTENIGQRLSQFVTDGLGGRCVEVGMDSAKKHRISFGKIASYAP